MTYEAKVIADSICNGSRLTTIQVTHPRIVHSEFMTHCMFARNASSSRAIPFNVTVKRVVDDPFVPVWWGENQKGMQAAQEITEWKKKKAIALWLHARDLMIQVAEQMAATVCTQCNGEKKYKLKMPCHKCHGSGDTGGCFGGDCFDCLGKGYTDEIETECYTCESTGEGLNIHKQIVNRLLEPFSWITVAITGDWPAWSNYFALRCHKDAQPEIQKQAYMAQLEYFKSTPEWLEAGQWHLPYISDEDKSRFYANGMTVDELVKISTGRTARTSYLTQEGVRDPEKDIELHDRLNVSVPKHMSPFEHVCQAIGDGKRYGKYVGWKAYRHMIPDEFIMDFKPNHPELMNVKTIG